MSFSGLYLNLINIMGKLKTSDVVSYVESKSSFKNFVSQIRVSIGPK